MYRPGTLVLGFCLKGAWPFRGKASEHVAECGIKPCSWMSWVRLVRWPPSQYLQGSGSVWHANLSRMQCARCCRDTSSHVSLLPDKEH